jgi:hypothetical protein
MLHHRREENRRPDPESGGLLPAVTMMETADPRGRYHLRSVAKVVLNGTPIGSVLAEPVVGSVQMVIANVVPNQSSQVLFGPVESHGPALPAAASNPSFRHSVLPGRFAAGALGFQTDGAQRAQNPGIELCIPIQDRVSVGDRVGKGFA